MAFGHCFFDFSDGPVPSCPYIKIEQKDSIWTPPDETTKSTKTVYIYKFFLKANENVFHIDNAVLNITFSAKSIFLPTPKSKVGISRMHIYYFNNNS